MSDHLYDCEGLEGIHRFRVEPRPDKPTDPDNYPEFPGVYVILRKNESNDFDPIFVGKTDRRAMSAHFPEHWTKTDKGKCFEKNTEIGPWTHWGFIPARTEARQKVVQNDILSNNQTPCND